VKKAEDVVENFGRDLRRVRILWKYYKVTNANLHHDGS